MMDFLFLSASIFLLGFLPGRIILSFTRFSWEEKFAGSFAVSFFLYFFFSFITFISPVSSTTLNSLFLMFLVFLLLIIFLRFRIYPAKQELILVLIFFLGYLFILSIQSLLAHYTGGGWVFDWLEHYQRTIYFLDKNLQNPFFGRYLLTARPSLFNLVASFFLSIFGRDFFVYQIVSTLLNFSVVLPCFLICRYLVKKNTARNIFLLITAVLVLNPAFVRQITYTWTKAASVYFLLLGVYFYLQSISNYKQFTFITSFVFLALAYLTHYSAAPYIFLIFLHLFFQVYTKPLTNIIIAFSCFLIICLPWYSWSISHFGFYQTFLGNTSYEQQKDISLKARITKDFNNFTHTLIPYLPQDYLEITNNEPGAISQIYDRSTAIYSTTLPGNLTFTLCVVLLVYFSRIIYKLVIHLIDDLTTIHKYGWREPSALLARTADTVAGSTNRVASDRTRTVWGQKIFWPYFIILGIILSTLVLGKEDSLGIAHVTLIPVSLILICFAVKVFIQIIESGKRFLALLIICFLAIESVIGIGSMIYALSWEITQKNLEKMSFVPYSIIHTHWENVISKSNNHLIFLADQYSSFQMVFIAGIILSWLALIAILVKITISRDLYRV